MWQVAATQGATMGNDNPGRDMPLACNGRESTKNSNRVGAWWGGRKVLRALKNNKIVNEVNILWRLVAVGNG